MEEEVGLELVLEETVLLLDELEPPPLVVPEKVEPMGPSLMFE